MRNADDGPKDIACNTLPCAFTWMGLLTLIGREPGLSKNTVADIVMTH
jgi:hypothetical protein